MIGKGNYNGHCTFYGFQELPCKEESCTGCTIWDDENYDPEDPRCNKIAIQCYRFKGNNIDEGRSGS